MTKFPYHIISGAAGEFAHLYNSYLEPPLEFFYMAYLTCLGSAVADKLTVESEISPQPRLYTLILGESADDRKSTAINWTLDIFKNYTNICKGVGSAEGLLNQLKKHPRTLMFLDEFKHFVSKSSIQSSVLLPCVNTLFDSNSYSNRTKHTEIDIENGHLSMLAASTIETYGRTWEAHFTDIGFNNRLLIVPGAGRKKSFNPKVIPEHMKHGVVARVNRLVDMTKDGLEYTFTTEADKELQKWYLKMPASVHNKRLDVYALRLTGLLALNEEKDAVDIDIANKVIDLMNWEYKVRSTYDPIDADNARARIEETIRRQLEDKGELTERELKRYCHARRTGLWLFKDALTSLQKAREIEIVKMTKKSKRWRMCEND